ncbi:MAG TPA: hypothetical protein VGE78_07975 [Agromyces sp.]
MAKRAGSALFACDERIRVAIDELAFAEVELGSDSTEGLSQAIVVGRELLGEAFRVNRANHDVVRGTPDETRARDARIVELCASAMSRIDEQSATLARRLTLARRAPEAIAGVRADAASIRTRIPQTRDIIEHLAARYSSEALAEVAANPVEAEQLLDFAEHSARVAERRRAAGLREQANLALEAATEAVHRAAAALDAVETYEVEALHAESKLAALVEQSRRHLAAAQHEPQSRGFAGAIAELRSAVADLPAAGVNTDPLACLARLHAANDALDAAIAAVRERATHPAASPEHVRHAVYDADQQLELVRDTIVGHPGWIGPEALAQLAQSERVRIDLGHYLGSSAAKSTVADEDHRAHVIAMAQHVAELAGEALHLARRDIRAARLHEVGRRRA